VTEQRRGLATWCDKLAHTHRGGVVLCAITHRQKAARGGSPSSPFVRDDFCLEPGRVLQPAGVVIRPSRMRITVLIQRSPPVLLGPSHDEVYAVASAGLESEMVYARRPPIMCDPSQIR